MPFNMFPFTNLHNLNLDWIIRTVKYCKEIVDAANESIQTALTNASTALSAAQEALTAAQTAYNRSTENMYAIRAVESRVDSLEAEDIAIEADMERLAGRVANIALDVEGKVDNGNGTITGSENQLQVQGATSGDSATVNGTSYILKSHYDQTHVGWSVTRDAQGEPPHIWVFREGGAAVRIENVAAGEQPGDAVNMTQLSQVATKVQQLTGTAPTISAPANNTRYTAGELEELTLSTAPAGIAYSIEFTSGATPTVTMFPAAILGLETFAAEANTIYEINILDNRAVVGSWAVSV